jgi:hypothetical protein
MRNFSFLISLLISLIFYGSYHAQVSYGAAAAYGLHKIIPTYSGNAIQVRRSCDNAVKNIGFSSCGDLDTTTLKAFVLAANPLSAITGTPATAYGLRKLICTYAGSAIRVRSSAAGSPTLDIGFTTSGDLDTAALKTFVGANSAFVTTWYDQSGNGRNATQNTTGSQPRIVNAGVIDRQGNMPAIRWLGMGYSLSTAAFTTYTAAACFNGVAKVNTDVTYNTIVNKTTGNLPAPLDFYNAQMVIGNGTSYNFFAYSQTFNSTLPLSIWTYQAASAGSYSFYYNGTASGSGSVGFYGDNGNALVLGSRADGVTGLNGWISEVITFNTLLSATDRQFIEWSQAQYYSVNGPVLATLPVAPASASVSSWYDQSGNSRDAVQATIASQPRIMNAGVIDKNGTVPAIYFAGSPQNLVAPLSSSTYPVSISILGNTSGNSSNGAFVKLGTNVNAGQGGIAIGIGNSGGTFDNSGTSVIGLKEWVNWSPSNPNVNYPSNPFTSTTIQQSGSGGMTTYLNGTNVPLNNAAGTVSTSITGSLLIGGYTSGTNRFANVKESEVIVFSSALSNTQRTLIETQQSAYYNVTVSTNKYTPPTSTSYNLYVNGVGRESATDSVAGTKSTVGMGFIIGQTATDFLKDNGDYLTSGINCPTSFATSTLNLPGTIVQRWYNDWYVNKTDVNANNGTISFFFDFNDYGTATLPGVPANYELLSRSTSAGAFSIVAGTTKSVVGHRVLFSVDASNIPTNFYYTIGTKNTSTSPLPIELLSFDVICENYKVNIYWSVATESSNDHFSIERTSDGINYETIGIIKGAGTSSERKNYSYTDDLPLNGVAYYRLKQTDFNGREKAYNPSVVACQGLNEGIKIYPNPNNGSFMLEGVKLNSGITICNTIGVIVFDQKNVPSKQEIDISNLPDGIYFVIVEDNSDKTALKLIIQH